MQPPNFPGSIRILVTTSFVWLAFLLHQPLFAQKTRPSLQGYDKASYNMTKTGSFMKSWLIAGPVPVSADSTEPAYAVQEKAFKEDQVSVLKVVAGKGPSHLQVKQKDLPWQMITSGENAVMLDTAFNKKGLDFSYAYALAEIKADKDGTVLLGLGSDDAVKVWLNGKLVHENWIPRGINKDDDIVPLKLVKGSNQLLLKVQDMQGAWGFMVRMLDKAALADQLEIAAGWGDMDKVNLLIAAGADINAKSSRGLTPLVAAKLAGREEIVQLLMRKGVKEEAVPPAETFLDTYYASLKDKEAPGIAILVSKDGRIVYEKGFGYADIKGKKIITPATKFRIGSVTKQFTAAAILKLHEQGLISLNDKLSRFIPDFPRGNEVTIHQLLNHTSGIHSYTGKPDFLDKVTKTILEDSLISYFRNDPYDFNPGENFMYNNSGYFLLGYIIGKVSGKPYGEYLKETFFDPLQMKNTGVHFAGIQLQEEAHGYGGSSGRYDDAINWDMSWAGAAGALYSTLEDLDVWNRSLHSGKVLKQESLQAALTPVTLKNGEKPAMNYGYGLITGNFRGLSNIQHSGAVYGFISQLVYYPKQKLSIVMFSNTMNPEVNFDPNKIAEAFLWQQMDKQTSYQATTVAAVKLKSYTGRYDFASSGVMQITVEGDKLFAQLTGQGKLEIFPSSQNEFFWKAVEARIKFIPDEMGEITHAFFTQNGHELNVKKLKDDSLVTIDPALMEPYTGRYQFISNIVITITKEKDRLFAQATGQSKLELFPVSATGFVLKEINARITFIKDENNKVNKLKLHMNGQDHEVPRIE